MLGAFVSEWVKLRRRSVLAWGLGGGLLFSVFATALTIERTRKSFPPGTGTRFHVTIAQLSRPDGFVHGVLTASNLIASSPCACSPGRSQANTAKARSPTYSSASPAAPTCCRASSSPSGCSSASPSCSPS